MPDVNRPGSLSARLAATSRILTVEDDPDIADFLRAYFRASGYDVVHLDPDDPGDVVAAVERERPDVVLLDWQLRGFSGHDVYRRLRDDGTHDFLPVIVVTADATAIRPAAQTAAGLDGFVAKPFNANTLAGLVADKIEAARALGGSAGRDERFGLLTQAYLSSRLATEVGIASQSETSVAFGLVRLRTLQGIRTDTGEDGVIWVVKDLLARAAPLLPSRAVLARTDTGELAVLVAGIEVHDLVGPVERALKVVQGPVELPGGAEVDVDVAAGLAGFPEHAKTGDELYMAADAALADAVDRGRPVQVAL